MSVGVIKDGKAVQTAGCASIDNILEKCYPVGSVYLSFSTIEPSILFGFGTWDRICAGAFLEGAYSNDDVGQVLEPGLPNITGTISASTGCVSDVDDSSLLSGGASGCAKSEAPVTTDWRSVHAGISAPLHNISAVVSIDASRSDPVYGKVSGTVQPPAIKVNMWMRRA